jgi:ATP-dependent helicase/nuclease subunit A
MTNVEYYEDALQRYGIDYYLVGGRAFYSQQEIYDLLNLLRTLHSDCDEVSLVGALRSPMFGLYDETLFWLARDDGGRPLGGGLSAGLFGASLHREIKGEQRQRAEFAAATIRELRELKDRLSVADLIQESLRRTCYDAVLLAEFLGERKLANLEKLIDQARSFDRAGVFTLADFITQLSEFVARQPDEAMAATQPESTNVVRLMSIHQSKGLEFPVVIVPDVARPRRFMPPPIAFSPELGPAFKEETAVTGYDLLMAIENEEDRREHSRLFYVAATRAADYLIFSAGVDAPGDVRGPWMELLASRFDVGSGVPCSSSAAACPLARATQTRPAIDAKPKDFRSHPDLMKMIEKADDLAAKGQGGRPRYMEPVARDASARRQYSFSRLSGMLHAKNGDATVGSFEGDNSAEPIDARGLGTLVHAVLEELDLSRPEDVEECVRRLAEQHLPASEQLEEPIAMVGRFLASERAKKMRAATAVHRELEFLLAWPPGDKAVKRLSKNNFGVVLQPPSPPAPLPQADEGSNAWTTALPQADEGSNAWATALQQAGEGSNAWATAKERPDAAPTFDAGAGQRYLQGFIDCLYCGADGGWRVVDYKTNHVAASGVAAVAKQYEMQMLVYALAAETILKKPPVELTLYFLRPGEEYSFAWDAEARRRVVELVSRALP